MEGSSGGKAPDKARSGATLPPNAPVLATYARSPKGARNGSPCRANNFGGDSSSKNRPLFTFIDHNDDLQTKQIKDANARKAIRSHVMRDVRRRERIVGVKRPTKRENSRRSDSRSSKAGPTLSTETSFESEQDDSDALRDAREQTRHQTSDELDLPVRSLSRSPETMRNVTWGKAQGGGLKSSISTQDPESSPEDQVLEYRAPGMGHFDPFGTLPGGSRPSSLINVLAKHCSAVLIPMTWPVENKHPNQNAWRLRIVMQSAISDPALFFGYMCLSAAHRAVLAGRRLDLLPAPGGREPVRNETGFFVMKRQTIKTINERLRDPEEALKDGTFDAVLLLLGSAAVAGTFDESRVHLKGLSQMARLRGGINNNTFSHNTVTMNSILITDVKVACGLLSRPIFRLPWEPQPLSSSILERIKPPPSSPLADLASRFRHCGILSSTLLELLDNLRDLEFFHDFNARDAVGLEPEEFVVFHDKVLETEYALLDYPYLGSEGSVELGLHPIEALTRVAGLCHISLNITVCPPASGMGRALTMHLKKAIQDSRYEMLDRSPNYAYELLAWACFIAAQCSQGQPERPWFVERLRDLAKLQRWQTWDDASETLKGYLYVPRTQEATWSEIWDESHRKREASGAR